MDKDRKYEINQSPFDENLDMFAPSYTPENFTLEEINYRALARAQCSRDTDNDH